MNFARVITAAAGCVVIGATVASCSGSFGSGSGLPNTLSSPSFGGPSSPPTPASSSSVVLTYGESTSFQSLPEVGGYSGAIAFPKAAEPTAAPAAKNRPKNASPEPAPTAVAIAIGATLSVVKPQDGPDLNFESGKGRRKKSREHPARALAYVTLLPTHDATLESYPRIAFDVPREIASQYRDGEFGLALWNAGEKDAKYRLAVAELDTVATPPARAAAAASSPVAAGSAKPGASPAPSPSLATRVSTTGALTNPNQDTRLITSPGPGTSGVPAPSSAPTLPPERLLFAGTASSLKLIANRPAVFALYALPHPSATPVPHASIVPAASGTSAPRAAASSAPSAAPSPAPTKS
jgi:hypothetical protein